MEAHLQPTCRQLTQPVRRILVVDDEAGVRRVVVAMLTAAGYEAPAVSSAREALNACREETFDLVLSDVRMPEMDGHDLARWASVVCPDTPTMLMSANASPCDACPNAPHCVFLHKPFRKEDLIAAVESALAPRHC